MPKRLFTALVWALLGLAVALGLAFLAFAVGVKVHYWSTPIGEVPAWALPFVK